jgi:hypothetical protein
MDLRIVPCDVAGEGLYYVVDIAADGEQSAVVFAAASWAEAERYIADLGGG